MDSLNSRPRSLGVLTSGSMIMIGSNSLARRLIEPYQSLDQLSSMPKSTPDSSRGVTICS